MLSSISHLFVLNTDDHERKIHPSALLVDNIDGFDKDIYYLNAKLTK